MGNEKVAETILSTPLWEFLFFSQPPTHILMVFLSTPLWEFLGQVLQ